MTQEVNLLPIFKGRDEILASALSEAIRRKVTNQRGTSIEHRQDLFEIQFAPKTVASMDTVK